MNGYLYQATIIGKDAIPARGRTRPIFHFLADMVARLKEGQAIRMVIPIGTPRTTISNQWLKICGKGRGHYRFIRQGDSYIVYLWLGKL